MERWKSYTSQTQIHDVVSDRGDASRKYIREISRAIGWGNYAGVIMLWCYFDETYDHDAASGHAQTVTIAGGIAPASAWELLSMEWAAVLEAEDVSAFHMTDFEADKPPFQNWKLEYPDKRKRLLSGLLDVGTRHVQNFFGVTAAVENSAGQTKEAYRACLGDMVKHLSRNVYPDHNEKFALVFARHQHFDGGLVLAAINEEHADRFGPVMTDSPSNLCALQFADLIAYEARKRQRADMRDRYPFHRLREAASAPGGRFAVGWR